MKRRIVNTTATIAIAVVLWEVVAIATKGVGFVPLAQLAEALLSISTSEGFWISIGMTVGLTIAGLVAGTAVALVVGVPLGMVNVLDVSARGTINFVRAIPTVVLLPLLLASLGSRTSVVVILIILAVSLKMAVYVTRGLRDIPTQFIDQSRLFHLKRSTLVAAVRLPAASAIVISGVRQTVNRAYGAVILAGFLAGTPGLGRDINLSNIRGDDAGLLAYVVVAGVVSVAMYQLFVFLEKRLVRWRVSA